jgi:hypothetical protein
MVSTFMIAIARMVIAIGVRAMILFLVLKVRSEVAIARVLFAMGIGLIVIVMVLFGVVIATLVITEFAIVIITIMFVGTAVVSVMSFRGVEPAKSIHGRAFIHCGRDMVSIVLAAIATTVIIELAMRTVVTHIGMVFFTFIVMVVVSFTLVITPRQARLCSL